MLNAEEFIAFRSIAEEAGQSQSSLARQLIKQAIRDAAKSAGEPEPDATDEPGQNRAEP